MDNDEIVLKLVVKLASKNQNRPQATYIIVIARGDSMTLTIYVPALACEQGLYDIGWVEFRVTQKIFFKKWEVGIKSARRN